MHDFSLNVIDDTKSRNEGCIGSYFASTGLNRIDSFDPKKQLTSNVSNQMFSTEEDKACDNQLTQLEKHRGSRVSRNTSSIATASFQNMKNSQHELLSDIEIDKNTDTPIILRSEIHMLNEDSSRSSYKFLAGNDKIKIQGLDPNSQQNSKRELVSFINSSNAGNSSRRDLEILNTNISKELNSNTSSANNNGEDSLTLIKNQLDRIE